MPDWLEVNLYFNKVIGIHMVISYKDTHRVWGAKMGVFLEKGGMNYF